MEVNFLLVNWIWIERWKNDVLVEVKGKNELRQEDLDVAKTLSLWKMTCRKRLPVQKLASEIIATRNTTLRVTVERNVSKRIKLQFLKCRHNQIQIPQTYRETNEESCIGDPLYKSLNQGVRGQWCLKQDRRDKNLSPTLVQTQLQGREYLPGGENPRVDTPKLTQVK